MPPRSHPTARQARLGAELRKLREKAGMSGSQVAALLGGERAQVSHLESGRYGVSADRVRRLAAVCSAADKHLVDALVAMAEERHKGWWQQYRGQLSSGFLDLSELEHHATFLRSIRMLHIPGLCQTEPYARALMGSGISMLPKSELEARVEHRMRRREILDRPRPPQFDAFVHKAALRMRYCPPDVMRAQLGFLLEMSRRPMVTIRVVPFEAQVTGSMHSVYYVGGPLPQLDTVQVDSVFDSGFLDAEAQLVKYRALFDSVAAVSFDPEESSKFIQSIMQEM
ncbi:helix-turn-helix domain-containing protein [Streptomyces sp. NPDC002536]